jgi:hypothetical protein
MRRITLVYVALALLCLGVGTAWAAGSITGADIKDNSITGKDVRNRSLTPADFKGSVRGAAGATGPQGPQGAQGPPGPAGTQGPAGPSALSTLTAHYGQVTVAANDVDGGTLSCPAGQRVVSGGFYVDGSDVEVFLSEASDNRTGWVVAADNSDSATPATLEAAAYCAGTGQAVAARTSTGRLKPLTGRALRLANAYHARRRTGRPR